MKDDNLSLQPGQTEFPLSVTEAMIENRMTGKDPSVIAAAKALLDARMNPGSLLKITCADKDEVVKVCHCLAYTAVTNDWHRKGNTVSHDKDGGSIIELQNGSGILIAIESKGLGGHGKRG
jgi:hypothetical protein